MDLSVARQTDGLLGEFSTLNSMGFPPALPSSRMETTLNEIDRLLNENAPVLDLATGEEFLPEEEEETRLKPGAAKVVRRMEMCARAREESTKIMSMRCVERDTVRNQLMRERNEYQSTITQKKKERVGSMDEKDSQVSI